MVKVAERERNTKGVAFVDGEASAIAHPENVLCAVFLNSDTPSVLCNPDAWLVLSAMSRTRSGLLLPSGLT